VSWRDRATLPKNAGCEGEKQAGDCQYGNRSLSGAFDYLRSGAGDRRRRARPAWDVRHSVAAQVDLLRPVRVHKYTVSAVLAWFYRRYREEPNMDFFVQALQNNPELAIFLTLAMGFLIGRVAINYHVIPG
jgi:hypothetical protein